MLLKISERVALLTMLPDKGNFVTLKIVADLKTKLGFSNDEIERCKIKQTPQNISWDGNEEKEIEILPTQMIVCCDALKELDQSSTLTPLHVGVYEKFMGNGQTDGTTPA